MMGRRAFPGVTYPGALYTDASAAVFARNAKAVYEGNPSRVGMFGRLFTAATVARDVTDRPLGLGDRLFSLQPGTPVSSNPTLDQRPERKRRSAEARIALTPILV